ncbi:MAG: hypothetical protein FOGNACKC_05537 [Anaerolineae bacterium]|nr:hypothetical protein [Anaerolineae bacterium]
MSCTSGYNFYVDRLAGFSVNDLTKILKQNGVHVWGEMIADGMIIFTVRQGQAKWADYILRQAGVPLLNQLPPGGKNKNDKSTVSQDFLKDFWDWLNN